MQVDKDTGRPDDSLLSLIRCPADGGELVAGSSEGGNPGVHCSICARDFAYSGGILDLLESESLDEESRTERSIRDVHAAQDGLDLDWQHSPSHMTEIAPTIEALRAAPDQVLLELGCGNGRFTVLLLDACAAIVAVDFSREALVRLRARAGPRDDLLLVHADVTKLRVAPGSFDRALSTLVSNLPTADHRRAMYRLASEALRPDGRFVFGTHLHGIRQRYLRTPKSGRYPDSGIYRYNLTLSECRAEPSDFFRRVEAHPCQIYLPLVRRLRRVDPHRLSRALERVPLLNLFGALTVCTATRPVGAPDPAP